MGKFKRSKATRFARSINNKTLTNNLKTNKTKETSSNQKYMLIEGSHGKTKIIYYGRIIKTAKVFNYHIYGSYLCIQIEDYSWECYYQGELNRKFDSFNQQFYIKKLPDSKFSIAYYFYQDGRRGDVGFVDYKICNRTGRIIFEMTNGKYLILYYSSLKIDILRLINDPKNTITVNRLKPENNNIAFLSEGNGIFRKLGIATRRMNICAIYRLSYYQGLWNRFLHLKAEFDYLFVKSF